MNHSTSGNSDNFNYAALSRVIWNSLQFKGNWRSYNPNDVATLCLSINRENTNKKFPGVLENDSQLKWVLSVELTMSKAFTNKNTLKYSEWQTCVIFISMSFGSASRHDAVLYISGCLCYTKRTHNNLYNAYT